MEKSTPCANLRISGCDGIVITRGTVLCEKCSLNRLNAIKNRKETDDSITSIKTASLFTKIIDLEQKLEILQKESIENYLIKDAKIQELNLEIEELEKENSKLISELNETKIQIEFLLKEKRVLTESIKDEVRKAKIEATEEHGTLSLKSRLSELKIEEMKELYESRIAEWETAYNSLEKNYKDFCSSIEPKHTELINSLHKELNNNNIDNNNVIAANTPSQTREENEVLQNHDTITEIVSTKSYEIDYDTISTISNNSNVSGNSTAPKEIIILKQKTSTESTPRRQTRSLSLMRQNTPSDNLKEFKNSVEKNAPNDIDTLSEINKKKKKKLTVGVVKFGESSADKSKRNSIVQTKRKEV